MGLSILPASIAPSALPAPTMVCISSMKRTMRPSALLTSARTAFKRSSNSPRNLAPANKEPISRVKIVLSLSPSGTSPRTIRWASPSTIAVFPTPGSPISTGLFLVFLERIRMTRRISESRPITGSNFPDFACSTKSIPYFFNARNEFSGVLDVTFCPPRRLSNVFVIFFSVSSKFLRNCLKVAGFPTLARPSRRCSVLM